MRVLVTDAHYPHTLSIVRALGTSGIEVWLLGPKKLSLSFYSKYCRGKYISPPPHSEKEFLRFLFSLLSSFQLDLLIPVSHESVKVVAKYRESLRRFVRVEVPRWEKVSLALNKRKTYEIARNLGVPVPETFYPVNPKEARKVVSRIGLPVILKPLWETGVSSCRLSRSLGEFMRDYLRLTEMYGDHVMVQKYIDDPFTYCFAALYQDGKCRRFFMHREKRALPSIGGSGVFVESFFDEKLKAYSVRMLDFLEWHGVALVEFKRDPETGEFVLMEINPKFWASVEVAIRAGVNFPLLLCQIAEGKRLKYRESYRLGVKFWFPSRELQRIWEQPFSLPQVVADLLSHRVLTNVWLCDPFPHFLEFPMALLLVPQFSWLRKMLKVLRR